MANKYPCSIIQDLLPLYHDGVCGDESRAAVEEHLSECAECSGILERLGSNEVELPLSLEAGAVLKNHQQKEKRISATYGLVTAGILLIPVIVCLICNLAIGHALDWFFIVLGSLLVVASITVVPMLSNELQFVKAAGSFAVSLLVLLFSCCVYTHGNWFWVAAMASIFGLSLIFAPTVVCQIPLPDTLKNRKSLLVFLWDVVWLLALLAVCCVYVRGDWFWVTAVAVIFGLSVILAPAVVWQVPLPESLKDRKAFLVILWDVVWLLALLAVCCVYVRGDWFITAAVPVIFGLSVFFLPFIVHQIPLPEPISGHRGAAVLLWDTLWLYGIFFSSAKYGGEFYWHNSLLVTTWCVLFVWAVFAIIRYSRLHPLTKSGVAVTLTGAFVSTVNDVISAILLPKEQMHVPSILKANLFRWTDYQSVAGNICLLILIGTAAVGAMLIFGGIYAEKKKKD